MKALALLLHGLNYLLNLKFSSCTSPLLNIKHNGETKCPFISLSVL